MLQSERCRGVPRKRTQAFCTAHAVVKCKGSNYNGGMSMFLAVICAALSYRSIAPALQYAGAIVALAKRDTTLRSTSDHR